MRTYRKDAKTKYFELSKQGWTQGKAAAYVGVPKQTASDWQAGTGESLPNLNIKLTAEHKADIVKRADRGETQAAIAADYGVSTKTISNVARKAQAKKAAKAQAKKSAEAASGVATIYHETCAAFLKRFEKQSVDLLLTDPPYMTDVDDDDNDIDKFAKSWLS